MSVTVRKADVYRPSRQPYVKVGTWQAAKKVYIKKSGVWVEAWPQAPNPPQNVHVTTPVVSDDVTISGTWTAPAAGAEPATKYQVRIVFRTPATGATASTGWVDRTLAQLSYTNNNNGNGWQHRKGQKVRIEVVSVCEATAHELERRSAVVSSEEDTTPGGGVKPPPVVVPPLPTPPVPTSFDVNIVNCDLSQTWNHVGGNSLEYFEIETWLGGKDPTRYKVGRTLRTWTTQPWNAATVGRSYVYSRIRAVGDGGASAWVQVSGVMPGPIAISNSRFAAGVLTVTIDNNWDGVDIYRSKYGGSTIFQNHRNADGSTAVNVTDTASSGYARDNSSAYRLVFLPKNGANGWTGRYQYGAWCRKISNPVYIRPNDCNTWWSQPIPGKWRDNPQADDWFYQGKSISGNSYGTLFYTTQISSYFDDARIGYTPTCTAWDIYTQRASKGGLIAAVNLNIWTHSTYDDSNNAHPTLLDGPQVGPALVRSQQAWVRLPTSWFAKLISGAARGISYYVPFDQADNELSPWIGNVSHRYMILNKPHYGALLDGQQPGTLRVYHSG